MPVVFTDSPGFPLPADYVDLTHEGQRQARVNAVSLGGHPDLEVASWKFFREHYLVPEASGWYKEGYAPSPQSHSDWVRDWWTYDRVVMACPRGACKTTILLEDVLRNLVSRRFWEATGFFSTREFCTKRLGRVADQIEHNARIIDDFGKLKSKKGSGTWNRGSVLETTTKCVLAGSPIKGASLGTRPSGLVFLDDVEKSQEQVANPADARKGFHDFFFNALLPMARNPIGRIPLRVVGTLYARSMFIYWLYSTDDERIKANFKRTLMNVYDMDWAEGMGPEWIKEEMAVLGPSAFSAQCLNKPSTDDETLLKMHPELTTYHLKDQDEATVKAPFQTEAKMVTHEVLDMVEKKNAEGNIVAIPETRRLVRPFTEALQQMYRFVLVDYADTVSTMSDFSAVQCLGLESSKEHPNTLVSLDAWVGKVQRTELVRIMVEMALKWQVNVIGIESYPLQKETFERYQLDTSAMLQSACGDGESHMMPAIIPIKFPTSLSKAEKIKGMAWRFDQFRVKLPSDRGEEPAYRMLWEQISLFTTDMGLLENDDILDTLAMHQGLGKQMAPSMVSVVEEDDPEKALRRGEMYDEQGLSNLDAVVATGRLTDRLWSEAQAKMEEQEREEAQFDYDSIGYD